MKLKCPFCPKELVVLRSSAGAVERCPACGGQVRMPMPGETAIQPIASMAEEAASRPPESPIVAARREADAIEAETHWSRFSWPIRIAIVVSAGFFFAGHRIFEAVTGKHGLSSHSEALEFNQAIVNADALLQARIEELDLKVTDFMKNPAVVQPSADALDAALGQIQQSRRVLNHLKIPDSPSASRFLAAATALLEADTKAIGGLYPDVIAMVKDATLLPAERERRIRASATAVNSLRLEKRAAMLQAQRDFAYENGITLK